MECRKHKIKEMLLSYLLEGLDRDGHDLVERHLRACEDCRAELELLRAMAEDTVPDPGEAFWAGMPGKVYQGFQEERRRSESADTAKRGALGPFPRWAWAAAAAVIAAVVLMIYQPGDRPVREGAEPYTSAEAYEYMYEYPGIGGTLGLAGLGAEELETVEAWADGELASLFDGMDDAVLERDGFNGELQELDQKEMEQLYKFLEELGKEV